MKKRPLGQNFLIDPNIAQNIIQLAQIQPGEPVVEIGPGKGVLTQLLINEADSLTAIELDPKLSRELQNRFSKSPSFKLIEGDAAKFDYGSLGTGLNVVSNLPYYAATHIMKKLIHYRNNIRSMTLMLQKEVVDRLTAKPGLRSYGSLSVYVQYHCEVQRLLEIPNTAFSPKPKIDSSLIGLKPLPQPRVQVKDPQLFFKMVHSAFFHKRKMLKNNLKDWEHLFNEENGQAQLAGIDLNRRGETLSLNDFADIANHVHTLTAA
ncbi:MAG: ribosomal RNA small subunit methyltransferase A [Nitrospina sp.]|jgi:16S rRNA (adenine1518-N6/adenine1519-N6)-dimethyltransferase|nr:ribosomal RNA small subunit methyltransferase A [Nitrospina sp.]MBT3509170.1 ribosomal RNA small subunit methyltransferase A [Nitrospina sp.]MBT3874920.1 ribosomal RNA small subunit methyltransferase A [Nitrospina sp.]MBT4048455.1 ribosomal RNA small subunit methyltransferase A [Nitrospina sp.]MBT4558664.1 ribosomal RNA small subunit methyltransferase A [Nitrospina sp.]